MTGPASVRDPKVPSLRGLNGWILSVANIFIVALLAANQPLTGSSFGDSGDEFPDCNDNDIDDALDIGERRTSDDCNSNAIPDECEVVPTYSAGADMGELRCVADFDGDGRADLVTVRDERLHVFLARPGRRFALVFTLIDSSGEVLVGDFDSNGREDLLRVGGEAVELLAGNGDGTFVSAWSESIAEVDRGVAASDLDDDGDLDAIVAAAGVVHLLVNRAPAEFDIVPTEISGRMVAAGDLNGDGLDDIVTTFRSVEVHTNRGDLSFFRAATISSLIIRDWLAIAPVLHQSEEPWIALGGRDQFTFLKDRGNGEFLRIALPTAAEVVNGLFADLDGDGRRDLALVLENRGVELALSRQGGSVQRRTMLPAGPHPWDIEAGDFDGDTDLDVAVTDDCGGAISILWNEGGEFFNPNQIAASRIGDRFLRGDLDADGDVDVLLEQDGVFQALLNDGRGFLSKGVAVDFERPLCEGRLEKVDDDVYPDLLLFESSQFSVALGVIDIGFVVTQVVPLTVIDGVVWTVDMDIDGDTDVVSCGGGWIETLLNDGHGHFTEGRRFRLDQASGCLVPARVDADARVDFVGQFDGRLRLFLNRGDTLELSELPYEMVGFGFRLVDLDGDGDSDLVGQVRRVDSERQYSLLRNQDGVFEPDFSSARPNDTFCDLDGDGDLDSVSPDLRVQLNRGDGTFVPGGEPLVSPTFVRLGGSACIVHPYPTLPLVTAADFDGDGWSELIVQPASNHFALLRPQLEGLRDGDGDTLPDDCAAEFRRGDANGDGTIDAADASAILVRLFASGEDFGCRAAEDVDDSGGISISDAIALLSYLFRAGAAPHEPFAACGIDPTADVGCRAQRGCE